MRILERQTVGKDAWDRLVGDSPDGWVFGLYDWQELVGAVDAWGIVDHGFAIEDGGVLCAVVPLGFSRSGRWLASSAWGGTGPILAAGLHPRHERKILRHAFAHIHQIAQAAGALQLDVSSSPLTPRSLGNRWSVNPFVYHGLKDESGHSRLIDLTADVTTLWRDVTDDGRRQVHKAERLGYRIAEVDWNQNLDAYYRLHCETYQRTGTTPHPFAYFQGIAERIAQAGHARLWAAISADGAIVAFKNIALFGSGAYYHTGCSQGACLDDGVNYLLMWKTILAARDYGVRWFDVGEVHPGAQAGKAVGLRVYKTKFGGEDHRAFRATMTYPPPAESMATLVEQPHQPPRPWRPPGLGLCRAALRRLIR